MFQCFTAGVQQDLVGLLNGCGVFSSHHDRGVAEVAGRAAVASEKSYAVTALAARGVKGFENVRASAAGGEDDQGILFADEAFRLAGENLVKTEIIGDAGQGGGVAVEAGAGKGWSIAPKASQEFLGQVEGFSRRASVSTGVDSATAGKHIPDGGDHREGIGTLGAKLADGLFGPDQSILKQFFRGACGFGAGGG